MTTTKVKRDQEIMKLLTKFKICSRNQIAKLIFSQNTNPVNVCNRTMRRMVMDGSCLKVIREKDKTYCYTDNPSQIHHKSNKINHYLKLVDFYINAKTPDKFLIEPIFGNYEPDIFFKDKNENSICVEMQLTPISHNKMQDKINRFVATYMKEHDSKIIVICSDYNYKNLKIQNGFKIVKQSVPKEIVF